MPRVKRSVHARKKRRKVLEQAKGYWGLKKSLLHVRQGAGRALARLRLSRPRKARKRTSWAARIMRINAGACTNGLSYNRFIAGLKAANIEPDRKVLADLAISDPAKFSEIAEQGAAAGATARRDEIFLRQAAFCDGRSSLYCVSLCRRLAGDGRVDRIAPDLRWDLPLRLLGGLHYLVLEGLASWDDVDGALRHARRLSPAARGRAAGADQRGPALLCAPAGVPCCSRRAATRPARARAERRPQSGLGPVRVPLVAPAPGEPPSYGSPVMTVLAPGPRCSPATFRWRAAEGSTAVRSTSPPAAHGARFNPSCGPTRPSGSNACGARSRSCAPIHSELITGDYVNCCSAPCSGTARSTARSRIAFQTASTIPHADELEQLSRAMYAAGARAAVHLHRHEPGAGQRGLRARGAALPGRRGRAPRRLRFPRRMASSGARGR